MVAAIITMSWELRYVFLCVERAQRVEVISRTEVKHKARTTVILVVLWPIMVVVASTGAEIEQRHRYQA
jgi:hypothetical protein